jgi:hypothetical protein
LPCTTLLRSLGYMSCHMTLAAVEAAPGGRFAVAPAFCGLGGQAPRLLGRALLPVAATVLVPSGGSGPGQEIPGVPRDPDSRSRDRDSRSRPNLEAGDFPIPDSGGVGKRGGNGQIGNGGNGTRNWGLPGLGLTGSFGRPVHSRQYRGARALTGARTRGPGGEDLPWDLPSHATRADVPQLGGGPHW